jgi:Family of unknown function (DUF5995)
MSPPTPPVPPAGPRVTTIAGVIARMEAIDVALPASDGLACFNRVYLDVTRQVDADMGQRIFADPVFLTTLDVVFANHYFDAVNAVTTAPHDLPTAWAPLLEDRGNTDIEPIQFALAGMNAHINNDLPASVVATCQQLATAPDDGSHYADYQKVDQLLDAVEQSVRQSFESGVVLATDRHLEAVCNLVANWSITAARDVAWNTSLALWAIRDVSLARNLLAHSLSRTVAMASRALLAAV